jgi:Phage QLRG family, putative DNA packaging.
MAVYLCTVAEAKWQIGIDHDLDDAAIESLIAAASGAIINYLKSDADRYLTSSGNLATDTSTTDPPDFEPVRNATIMLTEVFYNDRNGGPSTEWPRGYLPNKITSQLWQLRKPALG